VNLLDAALSYAARGWPVFPVHTPTEGKCSCDRHNCDRSGKHPRTAHGLKDASTDPEQIRAWWTTWPTANIGLRTGNGLVVVDCDPGRSDTEGFERALPDTLTVHTGGGGRHYFFRGKAPCSQNRLAPGVDVRGEGGYVVAAPSLHASGRSYSWDVGSSEELAELPAELAEAAARKPAPAPGAPSVPLRAPAAVPAASPAASAPVTPKAIRRARAWLAKRPPAVEGEGGDQHTFESCIHVLGFGLDQTTAFVELWPWNLRCEPPWPEDKLRRKISEAAKSDVLAGLIASRSAPSTAVDPSKPTIRIGVDLHRVVAEAVRAIGADDRTYQRGGQLVHVTRDEGITDTLVVRRMQPATIKVRLTACANFTKPDSRSGGDVSATPADDIVQAIAAQGEYPGVRPLVGLLEAPALLADGQVLQTAGYDQGSGYLYDPRETFPAVAANPTRDEALAAIAQLEEVFVDFPFARPEHASSALAFLLTVLARPAIAGNVPIFLVDATTRGTGKGRLVDAVSTIVLGRDAPKTSIPEDDDTEMGKLIMSIVSEGAPLVVLDNVTRAVVSKSLDLAITSTVLKQRLLGHNSITIHVPHRAVWSITGNNVEMGGDLARRAIPIRLESKLENPEGRTDFRHPHLLAWVRENRPRLVHAALTVLRAWVVAGSPRPTKFAPLGSFEEWSSLVPCALTWLGRTDPLLGRADLEGGDRAKTSLLGVLEGWRLLDPTNEGISGARIASTLWPVGSPPPVSPGWPELREAFEGLTGTPGGKPPSGLKVGQSLGRVRRRVVGGCSLDSRKGHGSQTLWFLLRETRERRPKSEPGEYRSVQNNPSNAFNSSSNGEVGEVGEVDPKRGSPKCQSPTNTLETRWRNTPPTSPTSPRWADDPDERAAIQAEAVQ